MSSINSVWNNDHHRHSLRSIPPVKNLIRKQARDLGFDDCRFTHAASPPHAREFEHWLQQQSHGEMQYLERNASKRLNPALVLPGARSFVILAASYFQNIEHGQNPSPTGVIARYARYSDYHDILQDRLNSLAAFVDATGGPGTRSLGYVDTGPILERDLAQRAGLGFTGKHTNLISRSLGNWFFLAEIITTLELEPDPPEPNRCGTCARCLAACPTSAFIAPFQLDARLCISYLTIELKGSIPEPLRPAIGNRIFGCDDCLAACPWNRFAREGRLMKAHSRTNLEQPDLLAWLALDDSQFKATFKNTPVLRSKRRGFLRNVCVALGNTGDAAALPALRRAMEDPEPLIAEHACWAVHQIELRLTAQRSPSNPE